MPKIRLAVNVRKLIPGKIGGQEQAFRDVFDVLLRKYRSEIEVTLLTSFLCERSFGDWEGLVRLRSVPEERRPGSLAAALRNYDVLYCPLLFLEPERPPVPSVVMIPDLQHEELPELFPREILASRIRLVRAGAARANRVLTVSEHSRQHLLRCFHLPDEHVVVTHLDCARRFDEPADPKRLASLRQRLDLPETYAVFPANNWPHKNHRGLFRGLRACRETYGSAPHVILTGALVEGLDLREEAAAAGVADLVRHVGFVDDADMPTLYDGAACLVFVSLFEGFGIPVVEAMRRRTPVIASDRTSLPEIAGEHALLVDPEDPAAIAGALHRVLDRPEEARARADAALVWSRRFSAVAAADRTLEVLRAVAAEGPPTAAARRADARPEVLVVTPSLNQAALLRPTIDSVLAQDYDRLDYCVADGGSTDDSARVLSSYGDRVRWVSEPDGGPAAAVGVTWRATDAEIVACLACGDTLPPDTVTAAVRDLLEHPEKLAVRRNASTFVRREVFRVIDWPDVSRRLGFDDDLGALFDFTSKGRIFRWLKKLAEASFWRLPSPVQRLAHDALRRFRTPR